MARKKKEPEAECGKVGEVGGEKKANGERGEECHFKKCIDCEDSYRCPYLTALRAGLFTLSLPSMPQPAIYGLDVWRGNNG